MIGSWLTSKTPRLSVAVFLAKTAWRLASE